MEYTLYHQSKEYKVSVSCKDSTYLVHIGKEKLSFEATFIDAHTLSLKEDSAATLSRVFDDGTQKTVVIDGEQFTFEEAKEILSLPKELGNHPETGEPVLLMSGRFGAYVKSGKSSHSIGKTPLTEITLEKGVELLKKKKKKGKKTPSKKKS